MAQAQRLPKRPEPQNVCYLAEHQVPQEAFLLPEWLRSLTAGKEGRTYPYTAYGWQTDRVA